MLDCSDVVKRLESATVIVEVGDSSLTVSHLRKVVLHMIVAHSNSSRKKGAFGEASVPQSC